MLDWLKHDTFILWKIMKIFMVRIFKGMEKCL